MKLKIVATIDCDNAAFTDNPYEFSLVLDRLVSKLKRCYESGTVLDSNGNEVARFTMTKGK